LDSAWGPTRPLKGEIYHYSFRDADDLLERCKKYARLWVEAQIEDGKSASLVAPYTHAAATWLRAYILKRGFLDGMQGRRIADCCARGVFFKYELLRESQKSLAASTRPT
jgi:(heptosyl)LPS beta-1,4-glucosyltransferase